MQQDFVGAGKIDLTREIAFPGDIQFDPEKIIIHGSYGDQLSAYRAKKIWVDTLESCFLLESGHDFTITVRSDLGGNDFGLSCNFLSACGRYAFWRLTNEQAPEAQYILETAHIPNSELRSDDFFAAPDMKSMLDQTMERSVRQVGEATSMVEKIFARIRSFVQS